MEISNRMYSKTELGLLFFPEATSKATARRHLMDWICELFVIIVTFNFNYNNSNNVIKNIVNHRESSHLFISVEFSK